MSKHPWDENHWLPGVLSRRQIKKLTDNGYIFDFDIPEDDRDKHESSVDLRLSNEYYILKKGSLKPYGGSAYKKILQNSEFADKYELKDDSIVLKSKNVYVFRLKERLTCKLKNIYGQATAKSSIGRLDVIARLIVDGEYQYEYFDSNHLSESNGEMYLEIIPISFDIEVNEGSTLAQLRFFYGRIEDAIIEDKDFLKSILIGSKEGMGYLSVDTTNIHFKGKRISAFRSKVNLKKNNEKEELLPIQVYEKCKKLDYKMYWVSEESVNNQYLQLIPDEFYIIRSKERIALPPGVAVYCKAIDESLGEMRIHYAGFVHPNFGLLRSDDKEGTPLIFEVRAHNVQVQLTDGERLAKLIFYRMSEYVELKQDSTDLTEQIEKERQSGYGNQELKLSKYFSDPFEIEQGKQDAE